MRNFKSVERLALASAMKHKEKDSREFFSRFKLTGIPSFPELVQARSEVGEDVKHISDVANNVADNSSQLNQLSSQLSERADLQEAQNNQLASAITEMNSSAQGVTERTITIAQTANNARDEAEQGCTIVAGTAEAISTLTSLIHGASQIIEQLNVNIRPTH